MKTVAFLLGGVIALVGLLSGLAWYVGYETGRLQGEYHCRAVLETAAKEQTDERAKGKHK